MQQEQSSSALALVIRAAALAAIVVGASSLGILLLSSGLGAPAYFWRNEALFSDRLHLVKTVFATALLAGATTVGIALALRHRSSEVPERVWRLVQAVSPVAPLAFVPILLRWELWKNNELVFLALTLGVALALRLALTAAIRARPFELLGGEVLFRSRTWYLARSVYGRAPGWVWLCVAVTAAAAYALWFSYYTAVWHGCVRSGYDLAIENNILWNLLHGGPFFKAAPTLGPTGSHFARHATLVSYLLLPFYALHQSADMVLIMQSVLMGAAAIPLFLLGRPRVGAPLAALIAVLYLMHPAVQQSNLFEMHYIKLGTLPFWTTLWLLDSRRYRWALVMAGVTLMVREDVATWILLLGAFGIATGQRFRTSLYLVAGGLLYVGLVKFVIMPSLAQGNDELMFMYHDLLPAGKGSFGWAMVTAMTNPAYLLNTLLTVDKLIYLLHILTPLVFIPLRRSIGWVALIPGFVFSLLSTRYPPLVDIHFQYSPHLLAMLFPALVVVLGWELQAEKSDAWEKPQVTGEFLPGGLVCHAGTAGMVGAMVISTLLCSSQYGAVIQQETSRGGPVPYRFGWDDEGRTRRQAVDELLKILPKDASVAASAFAVTQVSSRPNAYSLSLGLYDAEYIFSTTNRNELVPDEVTRMAQVFASGDFGVVAVRRPFFLMRRGHSTQGNASVQNGMR